MKKCYFSLPDAEVDEKFLNVIYYLKCTRPSSFGQSKLFGRPDFDSIKISYLHIESWNNKKTKTSKKYNPNLI